MALGLTSALTFTVSEVVSEVVDWIYTMPRKQDQDETNKGSVESEPPQKRSPPPRPFKAFFSDLPDGTEWIKTVRLISEKRAQTRTNRGCAKCFCFSGGKKNCRVGCVLRTADSNF